MIEIEIGKVYEFSKTFTDEDVNAFAKISEDNNPIHIDDSYASGTIFGKRVVHGILITSMFSKIFGTIYPGIGGIYLSQTAKFLKPVFLNEEITAKATLREFDSSTKKGIFTTECFKANGDLVVTGEGKILFPK
ncbi:MAG: MaoC family dehydratase [Ginsengibacter sp.]